ncbi:MAG: DUF2508 family protein [Clostridia bacterium]|nr:DUF2508 family protein [Clostridia bacterium]
MYDEYEKEQIIKEKTEAEREIELIKTIIQTREALKTNNINFEFAKEELIDYYSYEIKATQAKLDYLIKLAKIKGIEVDMINNQKYSFFNESEEAV